MTSPPLRVLHVEDDAFDRELAKATLEQDGLRVELAYADSREQFEAALAADRFDLILSDYSLPAFDGLTALGLARRLAPETPFIFLSGTLGEDLAVERLKDGATDYVLKQRITRLAPAVRRALNEAGERSARERAQDEVRRLNADLEQRVAQRTAELAAAQDLLNAIIDHSPLSITVKDLDGCYLLVNKGSEKYFLRPAAEVIGTHPQEVLPTRAAEVYAAHDREVVAAGHAIRFEEPFLSGGTVGVLSSTRFPLRKPSGEIYAVCAISEDVTQLKQQEDDLRHAKLEAQRASLAKNEFLSHMSHDLRTPLNAILGFAQLLQDEPLSDNGRDGVRQILDGGLHLLALINDVLDIAQIEAGRLTLSSEPVLVSEIVDRAINLVRPLAVPRGITIRSDIPEGSAAIAADRQRLSQILINLLSNAVKYNRDGGRVTVALAPRESGTLRICVTDTGAGIPPGKLKLLFQPFERLGAESTGVEGTGLGLALSRRLAEAMRGSLGVETTVDRGSTFWIELPSAAAPARDDTAAAHPPQAVTTAARGTILYVEDNPANLRLMQRIVERLPGVVLTTATNGADALAQVATALPSAVLLDMHLPDMPGEEILRRLWADPATRAIPKIIVTADATPGLGRKLKAAGAAAFLTKPLDIGDVQRLLVRVLTKQQAELE